MQKPLMLIIPIAALLTSCATTTMGTIMQSWRGEHIDRVVERWGYPNAERDFRGRKLYIWNDGGTYIVPSFGSASGSAVATGARTTSVYATTTSIGGGAIQGVCERVLEVDPTGKVVGTQWQGNDCCVMAVAGRCATWANPARP